MGWRWELPGDGFGKSTTPREGYEAGFKTKQKGHFGQPN